MILLNLTVLLVGLALIYAYCLWFASRGTRGAETQVSEGDLLPSDPARPPGSLVTHRRHQARYFATTNLMLAVLLVALCWLVFALFSDKLIGQVLAHQLTSALTVDGEPPSQATIDLLIEKARNRSAYPSAYHDQPVNLMLKNIAYWYSQSKKLADVVMWLVGLLLIGMMLAWRSFRFGRTATMPQQSFEALSRGVLQSISLVAVLCSIGIVLSLLTESVLFFTEISLFDFLFGLDWNPQIAIRADQVASQGAFGFVPLLTGTLLITAIAITLAFTVGTMIAIFTSEYASDRQRAFIKPTLEILTGIPTVVYGAFAALYVGPWLRDLFAELGLYATVESALVVGVIMGVMIIPLVSSLIDDALHQIPNSIREGMLALGATRLEVVRMVLLPASLPGIVAALLLAISRAFGETMIVVMAAGLAAKLTINPLEAVTTVTVQIATILVGDQSFDSVKTLSAFALGLTLFVITLSLNVLAFWVTKRYRVSYQ